MCEMMGGGSSAMTFFGHQPLSETADCLFMLPTPISAPCGENAFFKIKIDDSSPESSKRSRDGSISVSRVCDTVCGIHDAPVCVVPIPCVLPTLVYQMVLGIDAFEHSRELEVQKAHRRQLRIRQSAASPPSARFQCVFGRTTLHLGSYCVGVGRKWS